MEVLPTTTWLIEDNHKLSVFIEEPNVGQLLATRGGSVQVDVIAAILNRTVPTREDIAKACVNLYILKAIRLTKEYLYKMMIGSRVTSTEINSSEEGVQLRGFGNGDQILPSIPSQLLKLGSQQLPSQVTRMLSALEISTQILQ